MECQICKKRNDLIKELISHGKKNPSDRRNAGLDAFDSATMQVIPESGARSRLKECCDGVVGSVMDSFGNQKPEHHHRCAKCGTRFPKEGSYAGAYVNDDLIGE